MGAGDRARRGKRTPPPGAVLSPFSAYLILRGIETLGLRMERHQANARAVAEWLEGHKKVRRGLWPGLASHEQALG